MTKKEFLKFIRDYMKILNNIRRMEERSMGIKYGFKGALVSVAIVYKMAKEIRE